MIIKLSNATINHLNNAAPWLALLLLRMLIGWEFLDAGLEKFNGVNWFSHIKNDFPFPFNIIPTDISWFMATWFEIIGGTALIIGIGTRFFAASLMILTIVATLAVHWPAQWDTLADLAKGYAITDKGFGNFKLPLMYLIMLISLLFSGPGKLSLDTLIWRKFNKFEQ
jgi:putative oxidoreductase